MKNFKYHFFITLVATFISSLTLETVAFSGPTSITIGGKEAEVDESGRLVFTIPSGSSWGPGVNLGVNSGVRVNTSGSEALKANHDSNIDKLRKDIEALKALVDDIAYLKQDVNNEDVMNTRVMHDSIQNIIKWARQNEIGPVTISGSDFSKRVAQANKRRADSEKKI